MEQKQEKQRKMRSIEVEGVCVCVRGGGIFQDHGEQEALAWFPSGNYEKTLEEWSISLTGCDLHAEQITPTALGDQSLLSAMGRTFRNALSCHSL